MLGDFCLCPCFGSGGSVTNGDKLGKGEESDRNPLLLVSGMGGSILHSKKKKLGFQTRVWVRILLADLEFKKKLWSLYNPETGYTESLEDDSEIVVPDDDSGLYAIDILDPSIFVKLIRLKEVYHFHDMINMLLSIGYKKGTTLFGYGYDFRQSNRVDKLMEGLRLKLETAYKASGGRKIDIISHSMGGLLVSCFLALHSSVFSKYVSKWICIACPFQGKFFHQASSDWLSPHKLNPLSSTRTDILLLLVSLFINRTAASNYIVYGETPYKLVEWLKELTKPLAEHTCAVVHCPGLCALCNLWLTYGVLAGAGWAVMRAVRGGEKCMLRAKSIILRENYMVQAELSILRERLFILRAPGCINDSLLTGLQFVEGFESYFFVSRWSMHQLLVECPSIYEMLANPEFKWAKHPEIQVWQKRYADGNVSVNLETYGPLESVSLFEAALRNNELNYGRRAISLPFNSTILKWATETRQIINTAELPSGVSFYNVYGTSFDTPFDVCYGSETSPIEDLSSICHSMPRYSYVDGDGTVPAESARADGFAAAERVGVAASHRGLLRHKAVFGLIQKWLGVEQQNRQHHTKTSRVMHLSYR